MSNNLRNLKADALIKGSGHYPVMAHRCRWNGASGDTIAEPAEQFAAACAARSES